MIQLHEQHNDCLSTPGANPSTGRSRLRMSASHEAQIAPARQVLRVSLVTETFAPEINGVAMTLGRLVGGMQALGHDMRVVRPRQPQDQRQVSGHTLRCGLPIPGYPLLRFGLPCGAALRRLWRNARPDIVHIATEGPLGFSAMRTAKLLQLPVITSFHTNFHDYSNHYSMGIIASGVGSYLRYFHNNARATMVPSLSVRESLQALGLRHLRILSRGVDNQRFHPRHACAQMRASWGIGEGDPALLCVGRLAAEKNLPLAIRTLAEVRQRYPQAKLILVGDGPERSRLQGHPGVILTGQLSSADLSKAYASADYFIFPSTTETFGNVLTEAMASGLPVVAYDYAAAAERIEQGIQGFRVPLHDEDAFIASTLNLLGLPHARRHAMAHAAAASAQHWSWQRIIAQYLDTIEGALRTCSSARFSA